MFNRLIERTWVVMATVFALHALHVGNAGQAIRCTQQG
jgi:hypothetical protein